MARTYFLWDPVEDNIIEEFDEGGNTIADYTTEPYLYGDLISQHRNGESRFYCYDILGSTLALTDSSGNVTDTTAYTAFGEITERAGSTAFSFEYIGRNGYFRRQHLRSSSVRHRIYLATLGTWLTPDPLGLSMFGLPPSPARLTQPKRQPRNSHRQRCKELTNSYRFACNTPLRSIDLSGLACETETTYPFVDPSYFYGPDLGNEPGEPYSIGSVYVRLQGRGTCCQTFEGAKAVLAVTIRVTSYVAESNSCLWFTTDRYLRHMKERRPKDPFDFFQCSRMDICERGRWKPIGEWTEEAEPPNCPGFEFRGKCVIECCKARGMNVNFYLGDRALFLYDPIEDPEREHPQGMRIMSFIRVRALAKFNCPRECRVQAEVIQYPHASVEFPGWPITPPVTEPVPGE